MPISKTDFIRALQCEKMLWLDAHAPEHKIIPPEVQAKLDAGNAFGDVAMGIFGEFVETTCFREDGRLNFTAMLEKTKELLSLNTPVICEAAFTWYGNFCAADILRREGEGYALYEVKNAYSARKEFVTDLGFQRFLLRKCGVKIRSCNLILRGDTPPEGYTGKDEAYEKETFLIRCLLRPACWESEITSHPIIFGNSQRIHSVPLVPTPYIMKSFVFNQTRQFGRNC